tara:strand:+ start:1202 stop:2302 length:1101 start_codon:yes stop_codon:yes gene_type:complete
MKIILAGYGFYTLGNDNLRGGTIFPAIQSWANLSKDRSVSLTCMVRSKDSLILAKKRFEEYFKNNSNKSNSKNLSINFVLTDELDQKEFFDCGIIATPENSHVEVIKKISKQTKKIICVKPVGNSYKDYLEINNILQKNKCDLFIDFHKRFDESNIAFINHVKQSESKSGWFTFFYGQKEMMPKLYFKKWSKSSNPYQYLAPHYLDIILLCMKGLDINLNEVEFNLTAKSLNFSDLNDIKSLVDVSISLKHPQGVFYINSVCNWMEPKMSPYTSRQRIEFQSEGTHIISDQDNRGYQFFNNNDSLIPNPHFMAGSEELTSSGYGIDSYTNFLDSVNNNFPIHYLAQLKDYELTAKILDSVKEQLSK